MRGGGIVIRSIYNSVHEPADADPRPFDCWMCGGLMIQVRGSRTRACMGCDVLELRHMMEYIPRTRIEKSLVTKDWVIPYLDHGSGHYPSPA
jgi:hypothetical protein